MYRNSYDGVLEPWKLELINRRTRQRGLRDDDFLDMQQLLVLEVLKFEFDPDKSNGATEATVLTALIDRRIAMMRRGEQRYTDRQERLKEQLAIQLPSGDSQPVAENPEEQLALVLDVREAIEDLPPQAQRICQLLGTGHSTNEIAKELGLTWRAVREQIQNLRRYFAYLGLHYPTDRAPAEREVA